ncbi:MAG: hypothetical protein ACREYE_24345 [Gammaproteobacteria bacterium]
MAYNTIHFQHPTTGQIREAPVGFSWTCFFFGFFPAFFRGDWKWGIIMLLIALITFGLSGFNDGYAAEDLPTIWANTLIEDMRSGPPYCNGYGHMALNIARSASPDYVKIAQLKEITGAAHKAGCPVLR